MSCVCVYVRELRVFAPHPRPRPRPRPRLRHHKPLHPLSAYLGIFWEAPSTRLEIAHARGGGFKHDRETCRKHRARGPVFGLGLGLTIDRSKQGPEPMDCLVQNFVGFV